MFGIERLREEIEDLKFSIDELKDKFTEECDRKLTFVEMQTYLNNIQKDFEKIIDNKLDEIIKRLPDPVQKVKVKEKKK